MSAITTEPLNFNDLHRNQRDEHLIFDPVQHIYRLRHEEAPLLSVTNVISSFFPPFDVQSWAKAVAPRRGMSPEAIIADWEYKGLIARNLGVYMHDSIEKILTGQPTEGESLKIEVPEVGSIQESIDAELRYFRHFMDDVRPIPYRTEWQIYDDEHRIAGTPDLVAQDHNGHFVLYDWKRSKRMGKEEGYHFVPNTMNPHARGQRGLEGLSGTPYTIACLQQNLYRYIIRHNYDIEISDMYLVMLSTAFSQFHLVQVPIMDREVEIIINSIKQGE